MVNIAVLGYGTVGSGVVEVINTNHKSINKRAGAEINIKYVLDLRDFPGDPVQEILVHENGSVQQIRRNETLFDLFATLDFPNLKENTAKVTKE